MWQNGLQVEGKLPEVSGMCQLSNVQRPASEVQCLQPRTLNRDSSIEHQVPGAGNEEPIAIGIGIAIEQAPADVLF
jgi:hypothetical protein